MQSCVLGNSTFWGRRFNAQRPYIASDMCGPGWWWRGEGKRPSSEEGNLFPRVKVVNQNQPQERGSFQIYIRHEYAIYSIHELYIVCWRLRSIVKMRDRDKSIQGIFSSPCLTQKSSEYAKSWFWKKVTEWLSLEGKTKNLYFSPWQNQHPTNFFQVKSRQFTQIHRFMPFWGSGNCEQNTN